MRWLTLVLLAAPLMAEKTIDGDDFTYQGCIEVPAQIEMGDIAYYPDGDSGGPADGYPGSLFVVQTGNTGGNQIMEVTIPVPTIEATVNNCPDASALQSLTNYGCNLDSMANTAIGGGIAYYDDSGGSGEKIYWNIYEYYNVEATDHDSQGRMDMDFTNCQGAWGMTGHHSMVWEDYMFPIHDTAWADTHANSGYLMTGKHREAGCCGSATGIQLYAIAPWDDGNPIANNGNMSGVQLLEYTGQWDVGGSHYFPAIFGDAGYRPTDRFSGGAWVRAGTTDAIVITGRKSQGDNWYGSGGNGCVPYQGFHADPYENRWYFIDPSDLECVAAATCDSWSPTPYAIYDPSGETYDDTCFNDVEPQGGSAYDDANDIFYFAETSWDGGFVPVIHVYTVTEPAGEAEVEKAIYSTGTVVSGTKGR